MEEEPPEADGEGSLLDRAFEEKAEQAETGAALDKQLEDTFPTSDPSSNWAGPDIEPERPKSTGEDEAQRNRDEEPPA